VVLLDLNALLTVAMYGLIPKRCDERTAGWRGRVHRWLLVAQECLEELEREVRRLQQRPRFRCLHVWLSLSPWLAGLVQDVYEVDLKSGSEDPSMLRNVLNMVRAGGALLPVASYGTGPVPLDEFASAGTLFWFKSRLLLKDVVCSE
jgi:hypothetical protein